MVDGERSGFDGGGNNLLDRKAREVKTMGVARVRVFFSYDNISGNVGSGLVGVKRNGFPPFRNGSGW